MKISANVRISLCYVLRKILEPILFVTAIQVEKVQTNTDKQSKVIIPINPGALKSHNANMPGPSK